MVDRFYLICKTISISEKSILRSQYTFDNCLFVDTGKYVKVRLNNCFYSYSHVKKVMISKLEQDVERDKINPKKKLHKEIYEAAKSIFGIDYVFEKDYNEYHILTTSPTDDYTEIFFYVD